jgi:NMDA receptor-regulated gene protein 2 C-terminus
MKFLYLCMQEGQVHSNHAYSLWCLEHERAHRTADSDWGRKGSPIRILVRSQYHGFQERKQAAPLFVHLGLKLEWSSQFGAEMTTLSETTRDWVALTFRPEATLLRARVNPKSMQVCNN